MRIFQIFILLEFCGAAMGYYKIPAHTDAAVLIQSIPHDWKRLETIKRSSSSEGQGPRARISVRMNASLPHASLGSTRVSSQVDGTSSVSMPLLVYGCVAVFVFSLILVMFWKHGLTTILSVILYIGALSTMTVQLRQLFAVQLFNFPRFVSATHLVGATVVTGSVLVVQHRAGTRFTIINGTTFFRGILPAAFCFTASLGLANLGIAYTNAHFYEMVEGSTVLFTAGIAYLFGKPTPLILVAILAVIVMGQSLCWTGEISFSMLGSLMLIAASICRATKGVLNQLLMTPGGDMQSLRPFEVIFYNSVTCLCLMAPWAWVSEGYLPFQRLRTCGFDTVCCLIGTVFTACVIQVSGAYVIQSIGAVAAQLTGSIKGFLSVLGAWAALGEVITARQWVGYMIGIASIACYNRVGAMLKDIPAKKKADFEHGDSI